jgi:metal-sulfur cluster biosynthetic enzyme
LLVPVDQEAREAELRDALRAVVDPEIGMDVITLGLIRGIHFGDEQTEVTMILTTPFCPYGGMLIQQVKSITEATVGGAAQVVLGEEIWSPEMMEGDWSEWGFM